MWTKSRLRCKYRQRAVEMAVVIFHLPLCIVQWPSSFIPNLFLAAARKDSCTKACIVGNYVVTAGWLSDPDWLNKVCIWMIFLAFDLCKDILLTFVFLSSFYNSKCHLHISWCAKSFSKVSVICEAHVGAFGSTQGFFYELLWYHNNLKFTIVESESNKSLLAISGIFWSFFCCDCNTLNLSVYCLLFQLCCELWAFSHLIIMLLTTAKPFSGKSIASFCCIAQTASTVLPSHWVVGIVPNGE